MVGGCHMLDLNFTEVIRGDRVGWVCLNTALDFQYDTI